MPWQASARHKRKTADMKKELHEMTGFTQFFLHVGPRELADYGVSTAKDFPTPCDSLLRHDVLESCRA